METRPGGQVGIRPATVNDIEFMVDLFLQLANQRNGTGEGFDVGAIVEGTKTDALEQVQGKVKDSTTYVIEIDEQRAGRLRVVRTIEQIEIAGLQLLPKFQNRGLGTSVITELLREGNAKSLPVVLEVHKGNPDAHRLYLRLGFQQYAENENSYLMKVLSSLW